MIIFYHKKHNNKGGSMDNLKSSLKSIEHTIKCVQNAKTLAYEDLHEDREYHLSLLTSLNESSRTISNAINRLGKK